jgi:phage/conjugal plasmid C-4 type zinc finger TraR family protein
MNFGERDFDIAERRAEQERAAGIMRARQAAARGIVASGVGVCIDCGEPIEPARRAALPSAQRCIGCETFIERQTRRRA